jgi:hypothetical protein
VSGSFEVATWLVYALAAVMMLGATAAAILAGLALRFVGQFLREFGGGRGKDDIQHVEDVPRTHA